MKRIVTEDGRFFERAKEWDKELGIYIGNLLEYCAPKSRPHQLESNWRPSVCLLDAFSLSGFSILYNCWPLMLGHHKLGIFRRLDEFWVRAQRIGGFLIFFPFCRWLRRCNKKVRYKTCILLLLWPTVVKWIKHLSSQKVRNSNFGSIGHFGGR